ncbi:MAG: hypothetical protein M3O55_04730 [Actinomycetota bacterium]|nr:hypothetical protein [Actinomycetota bacterium]
MSSFVLTFRNAGDHVVDETEGAAWGSWFQQLGSAIVDPGSQVGATQSLGAASTGNVVSGYTVIQAGSLDEAVALAEGCPGLANGGGVEIGELMPM